MKETDINISFSGVSISLLGVLFIALKLLDKIDWSWWWVLAPFWISALIVISIIVAVLVAMLIKIKKESK